jgi:phage N-6-adenine-methyltransferase
MSRTMPKQRPKRSKQDYGTPWELIKAVCRRLQIPQFSLDIAASPDNAKAPNFYTETDNGLEKPWLRMCNGHWNWCNPPFGNIVAWVEKAAKEADLGAHTAVLVPASVGANWWRDWVEPYAYQSYLNGRFTFEGAPINSKTGKPDPYPKDCAILLYTPWGFTGHEIWNWRGYVP